MRKYDDTCHTAVLRRCAERAARAPRVYVWRQMPVFNNAGSARIYPEVMRAWLQAVIGAQRARVLFIPGGPPYEQCLRLQRLWSVPVRGPSRLVERWMWSPMDWLLMSPHWQ